MLSKIELRSILCLTVLIGSFNASASTITATQNGNWLSSSTWDCNCLPSGSDNITIPAGIEVKITLPGAILNGFTKITITVFGRLTLSGGSLNVDANDIIYIARGGEIVTSGLGGTVTSGLTPFLSFPMHGPSMITGGVLPIVLNYFQVETENSTAVIKWASSVERDLSHYSIEKSADGKTFTTCANIEVKGSVEELNKYEYIDPYPFAGRSYYRLKTTDIDGTVETFNVLSLVAENTLAINLYPNPVVHDKLKITGNFLFAESDYLKITSNAGRHVLTQTLLAGNEQSIDLINWQPGTYYLEIVTPQGKMTRRFVVN